MHSYIVVILLGTTREIYPIPRLWGRAMGCRSWVQVWSKFYCYNCCAECITVWIGLHLFNDNTRPSGHISALSCYKTVIYRVYIIGLSNALSDSQKGYHMESLCHNSLLCNLNAKILQVSLSKCYTWYNVSILIPFIHKIHLNRNTRPISLASGNFLETNRHQAIVWTDNDLGAEPIQRCHLTSIGNPIVEIRRSYDRLISTMGFPILLRHLYIESGPWFYDVL